MAIDEITDEALFELYQKNPQIRSLVDSIQKKYNVHFSQKDQPNYKKANIPIATKEAKETVKQLLGQQKQVASYSKAPDLSTQYVGLFGILATVAAFATGAYPIGLIVATITGATLLSQYQTQTYKQKPA
ncbi:hypothetical protein HYX03_03130 [Candidatus Woesearchaeota archaeon]|nr:hypothetical protein [Candidatus Woesearchaeota archaeon]